MKKNAVDYAGGPTLRHAMILAIPLLICVSTVYGQRGGGGSGAKTVSCTVNYIRLKIVTGNDDLRGGNDNLNITVHFGEHRFQGAANVNHGAEWGNKTVHTVEIQLHHPVPVNDIKSFTLDHLAQGGLTISGETIFSPIGVLAGLKTADNWDMQSLKAAAVGPGADPRDPQAGVRIAHHGFNRFTASDPVLNIPARIPANNCEMAARFGRLNPGVTMPATGGASGAAAKYGAQRSAPSLVQPAPGNPKQPWPNNRIIRQALAHTVQIGPRAGPPAGGGEGSYSALMGLLRRQSAAADALLLPAARPPSPNHASNPDRTLLGGSGGTEQSSTLLNGGAQVALNPQPLPPKGSAPQIGASHTMSASGAQTIGAAPAAAAVIPASGRTRRQTPPGGDHPNPAPRLGERTSMATQICRAGIATVDGAPNGVWFSPVPGEDGRFVIQGCGFGSTRGEVYLSGVHYAKTRSLAMAGARAHFGPPTSLDRVDFTVTPTAWSDRQIVAQIDPNASGLYDTNNVMLVVKTSNGPAYQAPGMNFLAARADQLLKGLLLPSGCTPQSAGPACVPVGVNLAKVSSTAGVVTPAVESPALNSPRPGDTIFVVRDSAWFHFPIPATPGMSFPGGTDTYAFKFAPGFQLDPHTGAELRHASLDTSDCQSVNGSYSHNGNWNVNYTSTSSFQVSWEEEACWPKTAISSGNSLDVMNYASVSGYELEITVLGPRGVSPWGDANVNGMAIQQLRPTQLLHNK